VTVLTIEGRRVGTKTETLGALATDEHYNHVANATRGSAMLRDAIFLAKGIVPLPLKDKPLPLPKVRSEAQKPESCPLCGAPSRPRLMISHIKHTVCGYYGIELSAMDSARREKRFTQPRQVAMFLAAEMTPNSLAEIGRRFKRDHTTVIHAIRAVEERMYADAEVLLDVEVLRERLEV
jgi:hypothetical protein